MIVTMHGLSQDQQRLLLTLANRGAMTRSRVKSGYSAGADDKAFPIRTVRALARMHLVDVAADQASVVLAPAGLQVVDNGQAEIGDDDGAGDSTEASA